MSDGSPHLFDTEDAGQDDSDAALTLSLGPDAVARGRAYERAGRVLGVVRDDLTGLVTAQVRGTRPRPYTVSARQVGRGLLDSSCSCPLGGGCKHVAAALLALRARTATAVTRAATAKSSAAPVRAPWERELAALIGPPSQPDTSSDSLGLRFELVPAAGTRPAELRCRPVRAGRHGRWVNTGVSWSELAYGYRRDLPQEQTRLLMRLRATATEVLMSGGYSYPPSGWLTLNRADEGLWRMLHQLAASGVTLLGPQDADVVRLAEQPLDALLDVSADADGGLLLRPRLMDGEVEVTGDRVAVLGEPGHGVAVQQATAGQRAVLVLAPSSRPVRGRFADWLTTGRPMAVPASAREKFLHEFYPALRRQITVTSQDQSAELPEPPPPGLRLTVHHPAPAQLELQWSFRYRTVDDRPQEFPVDQPAGSGTIRDPEAERALWSALEGVWGELPASVLDPLRPGRPRGLAQLSGLAAAEFASDHLSALSEAGVEVTHTGERTDYRRADGTPAVTVSTRELDDRSDWFDLEVEVTVNGEPVPFVSLFRALADGTDHLILPSGLYFSLDQPELAQLAELVGEARALQDAERSGLRIHVQQAGLWDELTRLGVVGRQAARWTAAVQRLSEHEEAGPATLPAGLAAELRPYQQQGFDWLYRLWRLGLGGILADDMGLGKTLQALALVARIREDAPDAPPILVVAPTSVVPGWVSEAARFVPGLRVAEVAQTAARRATSLTELAAGADVVVTSYTLLRMEADVYHEVGWSGLILDEAHFVKNHRAKTYGCIRQLGVGFTVALTGTPLENSLMDLWSMLSLTAPGMFPNPDRFSEYFRRPIERSTHPERLERLRDRIKPVMLRRTKEQVAAELPPKQEQVVEIELHPRHARIYQRQLQRERQKVLGLIGDLDANRFTILRSLTLLRQLSLDAALVDAAHEGIPSAKVDVLVEMLTELVREGHRALVFSQFTTFLKRVAARLAAVGIEHSYLDGRTRNRGRVIEEFRSGTAGVFLISLKAGGFGLNLTEADYCFVLDPWWNPAAEAQAVDRAHRIGQTRPVMVYRLVSKNTIEDKVMELKAKKQQLFDAVMSADGLPSGALSAAEIQSLLAG